MAYSRPTGAVTAPEVELLTGQLVGLGFNFARSPEANADIETVLVHASEEGMESGDLRVLAMLVTWLGVHHRMVIADRLYRLVADHPSGRVRVFWASVAVWLSKDRRLKRLSALADDDRMDLLPVGTGFQIERHGEDARFADSPLRVPGNALRDRNEDVLAPKALAALHRGYHLRAMMGAGWRAHLWGIFEQDPTLSIAEAARRARCSFAVAWEVGRDFRLLAAAV